MGASSAQTPGSNPAAENLRDFDIPAQPLTDALRHYAMLSRQPTLFQSELVEGKISSAVRGRYSPEAALHLLLDGTGLVARKVDASPAAPFILQADATSIVPRANLATLAGDAAYPEMLQAAAWNALCGSAGAAPGTYRSLLRFHVNAAGHIQDARLLGSTGDAGRDAAVVAALDGVHLDVPPPPAMPQPVTLLILPRSPGHSTVARNCDGKAPTP